MSVNSYMLKWPFQFGDREVTELNFRRLKGKDIKKIGAAPNTEDLLGLASKSAGEPPALFDEMDAEDVIAVVEIVGNFFGSGQATGGNS